jgi:zinc protease
LTLKVLSEDLNTALNLFDDLVKNPDFKDEEILKLKETIKADIKQRTDEIFKFTSLALKEELFLEHPLRFDEDGTVESLDRIKRDDILNFYRTNINASNMILSIFGDVKESEILAVIKKQFGSIANNKVELKTFNEQPVNATREKNLSLNKEQAMVMFGFHGPQINNNEKYGVDILTNALGSAFNGRLFNKIRENYGFAYALGGQSVPSMGIGMVYFYVMTNKDNVDQIKDIIKNEIESIKKDGLSENEIADIKNYLKGVYKMQFQDVASNNLISALDELYGLGFDNYKKYDENINNVTGDDIKILANKYLNINEAAVVVTLPEGKEKSNNN